MDNTSASMTKDGMGDAILLTQMGFVVLAVGDTVHLHAIVAL